MAKQKSRSHKVSKGGRKIARAHQAAKRIQKLTARRESGKTYKWTKNPYREGSVEWLDENYKRAHKNDTHMTECAQFTSIMGKLKHQMELDKLKQKASKRTNQKK